jgi:arsenite-transporting ATPase
MSNIDVEAVEDIDAPEGVEAPDYVLYGGKGGVGKTTMAAATALASARDGTATLVVSTDPAHSLSDTLETDVPGEPTKIREDVPLYAAEIDPEAAMDEGPFGMGGDMGGLEQLLGGGGPMGGEGGPFGGADGPADDGPLGEDANPLSSMPGSDEAAAIRLLLEYMDDPRFDRVVIDTAPTGHTLRLLELPEAMDSMLGKILTLRERLSGMLDGLGGLFGGDDGPDAEEQMQDLEAVRKQIEKLRAVLRDPNKTDFRIVLVPEELSVVESERLLSRLEGFGIPVGTIVVNRVMQDLSDVIDADVADAYVGPNLDDCEFCARRWQVQQGALQRSQDLFRGHDVKRVPLLAEEVRGEDLLRVVAACLD